jgi:endonuclease/exonuclease/phosphatase family metal-dependent hydrolase
MTARHALASSTPDTLMPQRQRIAHAFSGTRSEHTTHTICRPKAASDESRGALDADIDCDGETWRVVATHLGLASRE